MAGITEIKWTKYFYPFERSDIEFEMMNVMNAKKLQTAPVDGVDILAVLEQRLLELDARDAALTKLIIALEKTSVEREDVSLDVRQAEALLSGEQFVASRERPISQLSALHAERGVVRKALQIGRSRQCRFALEKAERIWSSYFSEIAEVEKRRVLLAIQLQKVNKDRESLREKIAKAGGAGLLFTDGVDLLGFHDVHDEVNWAASRLIADGAATASEIAKARG